MQAGAQKGRTTHELIATLVAAIEDHKENAGQEIAVILIDIIKAFDSTEHWHIINTISTTHGDTEDFQCTRGVRQGDTLSPILFNIAINPWLLWMI